MPAAKPQATPTPAVPVAAPSGTGTGAKEKTAYESVATATVDLPRARIVRGTAYGPGIGVKVPKAVAEAIAAENTQAAKAKSE